MEYFIFENTRVEEETVAQMYFHIINKLYDKNAQLLLEASEVLKISRDNKEFRAAQVIKSGYFIESNIDSNSKFSILKKLLILFELQDELLVKYADAETTNSPTRFSIRKEFWRQLLPEIENTMLFSNVSLSKDHWITTGAGKGGVVYSLVITQNYVRMELALSTSNKELNKKYFNKLLASKESIETSFGDQLQWEELPDSKMSRIKYELRNVSIYEDNDWIDMQSFLVRHLPKFEKALKPFVLGLS